ncbi:MAG: UDP-N-acetylmuramoyl-tripeptide--D-alanyl-D-alanine ligase [Thermoleophilaceae bacterium]
MIDRSADWVAQGAGGRLLAGDPDTAGPRRAVIDTREIGAGDLFAGLRGERADGGDFAVDALEAGAWGVLVAPEHAERAAARGQGVVIAAADPLAALQSLARAWRHQLGAKVIGVTGSTGKTSTKDILAVLLAPHLRTHFNDQNLNTEIGLPLTILAAPPDTEALVLEMAMRGEGQIAELTAIAEPDVGVIVNVGPVHLELLGTVERVAAAKAELVRELAPGAACVVPVAEPLLDPHLRDDLETITFGPGGDVTLLLAARRPGRDRGAGRARGAGAVLRRAPQPAEHAGRRGRGGGHRGAAGRAGGARLLLHARRGGGARGRGHGRERLLQRQPDVDAGGPQAPRRDARRPARGGARDHGRAGRRLRPLSPRDRPGGRGARDRCADHRGRAGHRIRRLLRRGGLLDR